LKRKAEQMQKEKQRKFEKKGRENFKRKAEQIQKEKQSKFEKKSRANS